MRKIDVLLQEYGESHQNSFNKMVHWICVPLIFLSIVGLIWSIPFPFATEEVPFLNWATISLALVLLYYLNLSVSLFWGMLLIVTAFSTVCYLIELYVPVPLWAVSISIFVLAWIGQFYGHKIEGKKPSFLKDIQFLLVGPAWLMSFVYRKLGIGY